MFYCVCGLVVDVRSSFKGAQGDQPRSGGGKDNIVEMQGLSLTAANWVTEFRSDSSVSWKGRQNEEEENRKCECVFCTWYIVVFSDLH